MSKDDLHPEIRRIASLDGFSQHDDPDLENYITLKQYHAVLHQPENRVHALSQIDNALSDESVTLRKRSQLLRLRQRLSQTHEQLLKCGR